MFRVSEEEFHDLIDRALEDIPDDFKNKIDNLVFISEPYPSETDLARLSLDNKYSLLGLYSGVPYTHRSTWYSNVTPDRIILFQKNIEAICRNSEELYEKVKEVLIHEIAHYFGMDEDEIREAGY
ncbi:MAG TPA: metallopeptidase family protein [Ignavibacteria bacterium]|nr:metallopeptidase family protein [Ignavibacteria bacterium]